MKDSHQTYNLTIQMYPGDDQDYGDPEFIDLGRNILQKVKSVLNGSQACLLDEPDEDDEIDEIHVETYDFSLVNGIHNVLTKIDKSSDSDIACSVRSNRSPASIAHARWLPVEADWHDIELGPKDEPTPNKFPVACKACGWLDYNAISNPFFLHPSILKSGKRDIFFAARGLFAMSQKALDVFLTLAGDEFDYGEAEVKGKPKSRGTFFWLRPKHCIGQFGAQGDRGGICKSCKWPIELRRTVSSNESKQPIGPLVKHFGKKAWNLALIGEKPHQASCHMKSTDAPLHGVAISGGMFAAIYNSGLRGLAWPHEGPLISIKKNEATWEAKRRYPNTFSSGKDPFMKCKTPG